jgi:hypothetical protein
VYTITNQPITTTILPTTITSPTTTSTTTTTPSTTTPNIIVPELKEVNEKFLAAISQRREKIEESDRFVSIIIALVCTIGFLVVIIFGLLFMYRRYDFIFFLRQIQIFFLFNKFQKKAIFFITGRLIKF